jgi:hypothetical protein
MAVGAAVDEIDTKPADILNEDVAVPDDRAEAALDPESDEDIPVEAEELQEALGRPPPVNSSYLPLPWKGRLGYVSYESTTLLCAIRMLMLIYTGLSKHLPSIFNSPRFLFPHMSHCFHH